MAEKIVDIGSECFANEEETIISYKGENFYKSCDHQVTDIEGGGASHCVKRVDHPGVRHEDFDGNTYDEIYGSAPETIEIPIPRIGMLDDGTPILVTKQDVQGAWNLFIKPTQDAHEEMTDPTRTVAALLRAINDVLPTEQGPAKEEEGETE